MTSSAPVVAGDAHGVVERPLGGGGEVGRDEDAAEHGTSSVYESSESTDCTISTTRRLVRLDDSIALRAQSLPFGARDHRLAARRCRPVGVTM